MHDHGIGGNEAELPERVSLVADADDGITRCKLVF